MNPEELKSYIDVITQAASPAFQHVLELGIRQQYFAGAIFLLAGLISIIVMELVEWSIDSGGKKEREWDAPPKNLILIFGALFGVFLCIMGLDFFFNAEWKALVSLVNQVKP